MSKGLVRVPTWKEFKQQLVIETKPDSVVYIIEQNGLSASKETTVLRVIPLFQQAHYIFLDFPKGNALRETLIPIRIDKLGNRTLEDQDVVNFLKGAFGRNDLQVCSFWTT